MRTSCIETQQGKLFIIGSNGLIGSWLEKELAREFKGEIATQHWQYASRDYAEANTRLIERYRRDSEVVFCGGAGGFSITQESYKQQDEQFEYFCRGIEVIDKIEHFTCISSLGAIVSSHESPYKSLIQSRERILRNTVKSGYTVVRMPSLYGYNRMTGQARGLIAVLLADSMNNKESSLFGRLDTSRNYLSSETSCASIARTIIRRPKRLHERTISLMASKNYTIRELCSEVTRAVHRVPMIRLLEGRSVDCESHYPRKADGTKVELFDDVYGWLCKSLQSNCRESQL